MKNVYLNPPLVEAVCEYHFSIDTEWDLTVDGLFYDRLKDHFPKKSIRQIAVGNSKIEGEKESIKYTFEKMSVFSTNDQKVLVQVGPRLLSINRLKPYPSWEEFEKTIDTAFKTLSSIVDIKGFQRIGMRYINRIDIPGKDIRIDEYFNFRPHTGDDLPKILKSFNLTTHFPYSTGRDVCKVQFFSTTPDGENMNSFILDFDYYLNIPQDITDIDVDKWRLEAHDEIEKFFEGSITDKLREMFKEAKK